MIDENLEDHINRIYPEGDMDVYTTAIHLVAVEKFHTYYYSNQPASVVNEKSGNHQSI